MREQTQRVDADADHSAKCSDKLQRLILQRQDLGTCLDALLLDAHEGRAYFKVYRQFKMYNDPTLNPYLYRQRKQAGAGGAALRTMPARSTFSFQPATDPMPSP